MRPSVIPDDLGDAAAGSWQVAGSLPRLANHAPEPRD